MGTLPAIFGGIEANMRYMSERQRVLATNIANSETPGFKARDLEAPNFAAMLGDIGGAPAVATPRVELTSAMRGLGAVQPMGAGGIVLDKDASETKPDGNNVTLEDQLLKLGQLQADFTAMTGLYRKQLNMLKIAAGKGGAG